ncbi:hypothetical protein NCC78_07230 [Micromonospora phytophila]|uniref:hypothetical protein n=1 Tax=Micromonospora phytophila TaxID=709888 RepID=UPI00202F6C9D|nr:hypothetical protein [Micromonospora phytophila]MCM0674478.1 hypothetical protein [Micromonospora phytophila]
MPPPPHRPSALAWQVFRGSEAIRRGLVTEHQLRGSAWLRLRHDVYADARLDRDHALACRGAVLRLPPSAVIAGPSAAFLHGIEHAATFTDDVHVLVPRSLRVGPQQGLRVHSIGPAASPSSTHRPAEHRTAAGQPAPATTGAGPAALRAVRATPPTGPAADAPNPVDLRTARTTLPTGSAAAGGGRTGRVIVHAAGSTGLTGGRVPLAGLGVAGAPPRTDPTAAAWETAVWLEPLRAVSIIDALLGQGLTSYDALAGIAARNADRPGGRRARWVFGLTDPGGQSPPESQLRVRLVLAGLPRPVTQHPVRLPTGLVLRPDLAWPRFRVAVEYDGHWHTGPEQLHLDRRRLNQLIGAGWLVLHVTSRRLHHDFPAVLREIRAALASRGWQR